MMRRDADGALTLKYKTSDLIQSIEKNLETHKADYAEAMEAYRKKMVKVLKRKLQDAELNKDVQHHIDIPRPKSYASEYEEALDMLKMCQDVEIELSRCMFNQLVRDQWDWSRDFAAQTLSYKG